MAVNDSTATTHEELAEQFPQTLRPFAVLYNNDPGCDSRKWAVNNEDGKATQEFADMAAALKAAADMISECGWDEDARKQAQAHAEITGADKSGIIHIQQHIEEFCITMDAYFDITMGEIEKHNSDDFDGLRFLTEAAKAKLHEFSGKAYKIKEEVEAAHA